MIALIITNITGTAFGFWYYRTQLQNTTLWKLIFVPDCPLYTLLFALLLTSTLIRRQIPLLAEITYIGLIKYGFWTVFVITLYHESYALINPTLYALMFILHIGMIAESGLIKEIAGFKQGNITIASIWFLANDYIDYSMATHPYLPDNSHLTIIATQTIFMTIALTAYTYQKTKTPNRKSGR